MSDFEQWMTAIALSAPARPPRPATGDEDTDGLDGVGVHVTRSAAYG
ncbi:MULTISPECIES: hypothetical protein [Streptomyces]|nr:MULTISPECIES: hypothetical protein [Streptomyces]MDX3608963.1 hypothetical protein [Streptomyces sp. FL06-04B]